MAHEIGGLAVEADVSDEAAVARMAETTERELGPIDLLVNNAGIASVARAGAIWEEDPADWWRVFEVNALGPYLCCRAVLRGMVERRRGRIVNVGSGGSYLPVTPRGNIGGTAYGPSKAAVGPFGDGAPWTPPERAPRLVRVLAFGRADRLAGRYLHAEHDDIEKLIARADEVIADDLNAIRLRR